jgi:hypothetical protein
MKASHRALGIEKILTDAEHLLRSAHESYGLWADSVCRGAERRLGVDPADEAVLNDPIYDRALKLYSRLNQLADATAEVLAEQQSITKANEEA